MKTTKKVDVKKFETLKTSVGVLKGGFSKSLTAVTSSEVLGGSWNICKLGPID